MPHPTVCDVCSDLAGVSERDFFSMEEWKFQCAKEDVLDNFETAFLYFFLRIRDSFSYTIGATILKF